MNGSQLSTEIRTSSHPLRQTEVYISRLQKDLQFSRRLTKNLECYLEVEKSCYARRAATRPVLLRKPTHLEGAIIIPSTGGQRRKAATAACCSSIHLRGEKESIPLLSRLPLREPIANFENSPK